MYNGYNMAQHTLPMEASVLIPTNNISKTCEWNCWKTSKYIFNEFKPHRGILSYQPKMFTVLICDYVSL